MQLDDPALATNWDMINPEPTVEDYRKFAMVQVAALNHAIRGLPQERIRFHLCWGVSGTVRTPPTSRCGTSSRSCWRVNAHAYSFEAGNVRHEHEWKVWQEVKLPDDKLILPGVVSHATNVVEHPELVADRIVRFANIVGESGLSPRPTAVSAAAFTRKSPGPSLKRWHKEQHWPAANCGTERPAPALLSLRGAQRRGNLHRSAQRDGDCFAPLAMTAQLHRTGGNHGINSNGNFRTDVRR